MNHNFVSESIAQQLADVWAIHRDRAFVHYLARTFGCEPLNPVRFAGIFSLQMIGGFFFPDLPAGPGPIVERLWITDDNGFRPSSMEELLAVENLESSNALVVYNPSRSTYQPISTEPWLLVYPRFKFCVRENVLVYSEEFGLRTRCRKVGRVSISDQLIIHDVSVAWTVWQGRMRDLTNT